MNKREHLIRFSSFKMGGDVEFFAQAHQPSSLPSIISDAKKIGQIHVLGGGTNTIFSDNTVNRSVIKLNFKGIKAVKETKKFVWLKAFAGQNWDKLVKYSITQKLSGLECLSGIPGSCGAAPIQNIGAYGSEIKDVLVSVEALDLHSGTTTIFTNRECDFSYRNSFFKSPAGNKYIVISIILKLSKKRCDRRCYPYLKNLPDGLQDPQKIRRMVLILRKQKLPDWKKFPNCGSFFHNPIVSRKHLAKLLKKFPNMPFFNYGHRIKLSSGWILETLKFKGKTFGEFQFSPKHSLVLTHSGNGTMKDLQKLIVRVNKKVDSTFGVKLNVEPNLID